MKKFHFPLDRAMDWRRTQARIEEVKLEQLYAEMRGIEARRADLNAERTESEKALLDAPSVTGLQLTELDAFQRFPTEPNFVQGFMGAGEFIVGDQPSTSDWDYSNPNRRAFYDLLSQVGLADAHLTDLYKRRGRSGTLKKLIRANETPEDLIEHVKFFRAELALLNPTRVVALGHDAHWLLKRYVPEVRPILSRMWHFAYVVRYNKTAFYENNVRLAFGL